MLYICPKCHEKLEKENNSYKCLNNHTYDISSKGYVNFLLNNDKNSINPGDSKDSLQSRNSFLKKDYYSFILNKVIYTINIYKKSDNYKLLDIGCGEGYYTSNVKTKNNEIYGFDISKDGIALATKYNKNEINWFVANSKNIPIEDSSINIVLAMFSFVTPSEIERVLKENGIIIQVCAGKNHLIELKKEIYNDIKEKDENNTLLPFNLIKKEEYTTNITIDNNEDILNLFKMTPHYYKTKQEEKNKIEELNSINLTLDIVINVYVN